MNKRTPGRPRLNETEKTQPYTISLTPSEAEAIRKIGNGNLSLGIRKAIENMNTMKYNYTTGTKGSVITLQDGRYADTVHGDSSEGPDANAALVALLDETEQPGWSATNETLGDLTPDELRKYVGA